MYLSVVIPAYNEEKRLASALDRIAGHLDHRDIEYEVIVVDDGSSDGTVDVAQKSGLARAGRLNIISNGSNKGKGFSVRTGIMASQGRYVLFTDADLSTPITEFDKLFSSMEEGYDIVMASRSIQGSVLKACQPWYRRTMGRIYNIAVRMLLLDGFSDTQCGFKLLRGDLARELACKMKVDGFSFDVELLYLAAKNRSRIKEIGVVWENSPESKVRVIKSSANMLFDVLRIRKIHN